MKILKYVLICTVALLFSSCEDVVELDLPESEKRLVVDAWITDNNSLQKVKLTTTGPYFDNAPAQTVSGATVKIHDDNGNVFDMIEREPGLYLHEFVPEVGISYTLEITTKEGEEYISNPEEMQAVPALEDLYYEYRPQYSFEEAGYYVFIGLQDPEGIKNFYRWKYYVNGELQDDPENFAIQNDDLIDGAELYDIQFNPDPLDPGDLATIVQYSLTEDAYNFLVQVREQITSGRGVFDTPPSPIRGNIINKNDPNETVLGYFGVSAIEIKEILIEEE